MMVHKATFATPLSTLSSGCPFCSSGLIAKAFCFIGVEYEMGGVTVRGTDKIHFKDAKTHSDPC
jgi:hypothetical protein